MTRVLPFPLMTVCLLVLWLCLNQTLSFGHFMLGGVIALIGGFVFGLLEMPQARIRRPAAILRLLPLVLADIVRSNIAVGRIILGLADRQRISGFVSIPLDLRNPYGLAALACIITSTPGTLWVSFDPASRILMVHVLDLVDEREWLLTIKGRYERLLLEIFP